MIESWPANGYPDGGISVDEATASLLEGRFRLHRPGYGRSPELQGELVGESPIAPATRRLLGKETACVGREQELGELLAAFEDCIATRAARAVVITAPAGAGKSRLAHELRQRLRARAVPPAIWTGRGDPMAASASLGVLGQLLRCALGVPPERTGAAAHRHVLEQMVGHVLGQSEHRLSQAGRGIAPFLGEIAGIPFTAAEHPGLADARQDAQLMHDRMLQAWLDWVDAETARGPVVCMLDDLQWSDSATLRFCDAALRNLAHRPLLVVALARSEPRDASAQQWTELWAEHPIELIPLNPLPMDACLELARQVLPASMDAERMLRLAERSGGNAFFLEELVRSAAHGLLHDSSHGPGGTGAGSSPHGPASTGAGSSPHGPGGTGAGGSPHGPASTGAGSSPHGPGGTGAGGSPHGPASTGAGDLPETILATVSARLAALPAEQRRVLRAASVFGRSFWSEGVAALLSHHDEPAEDAVPALELLLGRLVERELIVTRRPARFAGCSEYAFHHELIREAAYASLTAQDARSGHSAAGRWLEQAGESEPLVLADHYWRGDDRERALPWYQRAAEQALEANDFARVLEWAERACACGASGMTLGALRLIQAEAENWSAHYQQAYEHGRQAMALLPRDSSSWARAVEHTGWAACYAGRAARVAEITEITLLLAAHIRSDAHRVALVRCVTCLGLCGQLEQAGDLMARLESGDLDGAGPRVKAAAMSTRAVLAVLTGRLDESAAWFEQAVAGWRAVEDRRNTCLEEINLGTVLCELGEYERAITALRSSTQHAERLASEHLIGHTRRQYAVALARGHRLSEAKELILRSAEVRASGWNKAFVYIYGAEIALLESEATLALVRADSAIALCRDISPGVHAHALALRARALLRLGRVRTALTATREAMRILGELGGVLEEGEACLRLVHAEALHAAGHHEDAAAAITEAKERLLARAALIDGPDRRTSFLQHVADNRRTLELAREWTDTDQATS